MKSKMHDWAEHLRQDVTEKLEETLGHLTGNGPLLRLAELTKPILANRSRPKEFCPAIHLPLFSCIASGGREDEATRLAVATLILELSMDFLDRVWDEETKETWPDEDPRTIQMAGVWLMASAAPQALSLVCSDPKKTVQLHQAVASRLSRIAAGELVDVASLGKEVTLEDAAFATFGKTGERRALYQVLGAILAEAPSESVNAYDQIGKHYGYARQIVSDFVDLFVSDHSRDLASGSRTWPIAWMLSQLEGGERLAFAAALENARKNPDACEEIRRWGDRLGVRIRGRIEVKMACQKALLALNQTGASGPASELLQDMIVSLSESLV